MRKRIILAVILLSVAAAIPAVASDYNFYIEYEFENQDTSTYASPINFEIDAAGLVDGAYIQPDAEDVYVTYLGDSEYVTAMDLASGSATWRFERTVIPAGAQAKKVLRFGDADAVRDQYWIASGSDTCTIAHSGSLNFASTHFAIYAEVIPAITPASSRTILEKTNEYQLVITGSPAYQFSVWDNAGPTEYSVVIPATVGEQSNIVAWYDGSDLTISNGTEQDSQSIAITLNTTANDISVLECDCIVNDLRVVQE